MFRWCWPSRSAGTAHRALAFADAGRAKRTTLSAAVVCGGAMPKARSFSFASPVIQSVVHAGASRVTMRACISLAASAARTSSSICPIAGQPL